MKIGYVNSKRIFEEIAEGTEAMRLYEREAKVWDDQIVQLQTELKELKDEFEVQRFILTSGRSEEKEKQIQAKEREVQKYFQEINGPQGKAVKRYEELVKPVMERIHTVIKKLKEEEGLLVIFDWSSNAIISADRSLDYSDRIIEKLNQAGRGR